MNKTPNAAIDQRLFNLDPTDAVSNQQTVPCTWWCGTRLVTFAQIMEVANRFTQPAPDGGKKGGGGGGKGGKGGGGSSSLNHFGTVGYLIGCGPMEFISGYVQDNALVWPDAPQWPAGRGALASLKVVRTSNLVGCQWAAAHGCKVGDFVSIAGFNDSTLNTPYVVVQAPLDAYSFSWTAAGPDITYGPDGSGYMTKVVDIVAGDLRRLGAQITDQSAVRAVVADILAHCDGWLAFNAAGAIVAGHWPHNEAPPAFTDATTVDVDDCLNGEEIAWDSDGWDGTASQVTVTYSDAEHAYKTLPALAPNSWNLEASGRPKPESVDLQHVTRAGQALAIAAQRAKLRGELTFGGTLKLRREKVVSIKVGSLFLLTDDLLSISRICRCTELTISAPPEARTEIVYTTEPGYTSTPYRPAPAAVQGTDHPRPTLPAHYQLVQLPQLLTGKGFAAAAICAREDLTTSRLDVWFRQADSSSFYELASLTHFAVSGQVNATFAPYAGVDDDTQHVAILLDDRTPQPDLDHVLATQTDDAINDNALMLFLFKASSPAQFEILTVKQITAAGGGVYNAVVRRARYGTLQGGDGTYSFDSGDTAFLIYREELVAFEHSQFAAFAAAGTAAIFRLVPSTAWIEGDVTDAYDGSTNAGGVTAEVSFTFTDPFAATISFVSLTQAGSAVVFSTTYATTDPFAIQVRFGSPLGDMTTATIKARLGSTDILIWSGTLPPGSTSTLITPTLPFVLSAEGNWRIIAAVQTAAGRSTAATLQDSGSDAAVQVRAAGSTTVLAPTATPAGYIGTHTTTTTGLACATAGATIHYQIVSIGASPGGSWTTYTGTFPVGRNKTLYAYASKGGLTDSPVQSWDFEYDSGL